MHVVASCGPKSCIMPTRTRRPLHCRHQAVPRVHFAERYVHLASQELARQAWARRDLSAAHNLNWVLQEVRGEMEALLTWVLGLL